MELRLKDSTRDPGLLQAYGPYAAFFGMLCLTALIYLPGLNGPFLFDDYPNLERLGSRGPINTLELLWLYLKSGFSGPTGRPLSLLSFLIDANNWPAEAWPFKRTNLVIHLLVGAVLFGTTRKLLASIGRSARDAAWIGALAATLWLLNPFFVSTTLYAVQRMTQLAALFVLAGIWCYLHGRELLASGPRRGYLMLCAGLPLWTLAATLSKENGALLPLLVLVVQWTLASRWTSPAPPRWWTAMFLVLPTAVLVAYLLAVIPKAESAYAGRDFTMYERVLSQGRFVWDYLYHLFIPRIQTSGLFQDDRLASTGLLEPWTTLPALLGIAGLVCAGWLCRTRWPLLSLALLFFLGAHLLESTLVPLELYFEHRNYLPAAFLFLPLAAGAHDAIKARIRPALVTALSATSFVVFAVATWQHAALWGDEDKLLLVAAQSNQNSVRAQISAAQTWMRNNDYAKALEILEAAEQRLPGNVLITSNVLAARAELGILTVEDLTAAAAQIRAGVFDIQAVRALEQLVYVMNSKGPQPAHAKIVNELLQGIRDDLAGRLPPAHRMTLYLQGMLLAGQGQPREAMPYLLGALDVYNSVNSGLRLVSDMAHFGHYEQALELLSRCETLLATLDDSKLEVSRTTFERDIARLRHNLEEDLAKQQAQPAGSSANLEVADLDD
jgi:protein O-mannosyl-transferase